MTEEQVMSLFKRIKTGEDGPQLIEYLEKLSKENYIRWKLSDDNDIFVKQGYAIAVDSLLAILGECTKERQVPPSSLTTNWSN